MDNNEQEVNGWQEFLKGAKFVMDKTVSITGTVGNWFYRLRKFIMTAPVLYTALWLAVYSQEHLPEEVAIEIGFSGEMVQSISREAAVYGPLVLTCICLILVLCSRKTVYPWLVSIFSLCVPVLILALNLFLTWN